MVILVNYEWKDLFKPWILDRGKGYYLEGAVNDLEISDGEITARVEGSEDYTVEIQLSDGIPVEMWCCCPYADGGENCKHMAAVLFAAERAAYSFDAMNEEPQPWEEALKNLTVDQLRSLVHEFAVDDGKLQKRLLRMVEEDIEPEETPDWQEEIMAMVWEVADEEDDYIDYDHAYDLMADIAGYIQQRLRPLLDKGDIDTAFDLVMTAYTTVMQLDMDDSDGGLSVVVSVCNDGWREIFSAASDDQRIEMHRQFWLMQSLHKWVYGTEMLVDFFLSLEWSEELQRQNLEKLDVAIRTAAPKDYWLRGNLTHRERIMRLLGASDEDVLGFWRSHSRIPAARDRLLEIYIETDPDAAIAILLENKQMDQKNWVKTVEHSQKLIQLYQEMGRQREYEAELHFLVVDCRCIRAPYLRLLKEVMESDAWKELVERLLATSKTWTERFDLLCFEERYERLATEITKASNLYQLDNYEPALKKWSPEQTRDCYVAVLKREMEQATNRKRYWSVIQYLKKLGSYPDGPATAKALAEYWRKYHNNRPAMKDELRKAGY